MVSLCSNYVPPTSVYPTLTVTASHLALPHRSLGMGTLNGDFIL